MTSVASGPRPKESRFYGPVVYLIGKLTNWKPYVGVDHTLIRDDALRLAGLDLIRDEDGIATHATDGESVWPLESTSSKKRDGLYRVAHFGWYHQTRKYREECDALCARPIKGKRGEWALTQLGIQKAKALRRVYEGKIRLSAGPNVTAQYLGEHFNRFYEPTLKHLRRRMRRSEELDKIEDHAQSWIETVIQRNGLRKAIDLGMAIPPSRVSRWTRNQAITDIRNEAEEPVCRLFHGALKKKEREDMDAVLWTEEVIPRTINESDILCHNQYAAHSEDDYVSDPIESVQDTHQTSMVEESVMGQDAVEYVLDEISQIIAEELSDDLDPQFHQQLVEDRFVREMSIREIAEAHGLDPARDEQRITVALNRIKDVALVARDAGDFDEFLTR